MRGAKAFLTKGKAAIARIVAIAAAPPDAIAILATGEDAWIVDKPAGVPVDRPRAGGETIADRLAQQGLARVERLLPVHRLDRDTSGCLLIARTRGALKRYAAAFESGTVEKTYLAIVEGVPRAAEGVVDLPLGKQSSAAAGWRMVPDTKGAAATTHWRVLETREGRSLLELKPQTGRTHQLRVHCASGLGCPIVGDPVYGEAHPLGLMLHAAQLRVAPAEGDALEASASWPRRFARWLPRPQ